MGLARVAVLRQRRGSSLKRLAQGEVVRPEGDQPGAEAQGRAVGRGGARAELGQVYEQAVGLDPQHVVSRHQQGAAGDACPRYVAVRVAVQVGPTMVLLGDVAGAPFYLGHQEFSYYGSSQLTLDVEPGKGGDFSLDCGKGKAFVTRSRLFNENELSTLPPIPGH